MKKLGAIIMTSNKVRNTLIALYVLIILGFSATVKAAGEMTIFPIGQNQIKLKSYVGEVAATLDGRSYLVVSETEFYELHAIEQDLTEFNGEQVVIKGIETKYKSGPVHQVMVSDPLSEPKAKVVPVLVVFGISELVE